MDGATPAGIQPMLPTGGLPSGPILPAMPLVIASTGIQVAVRRKRAARKVESCAIPRLLLEKAVPPAGQLSYVRQIGRVRDRYASLAETCPIRLLQKLNLLLQGGWLVLQRLDLGLWIRDLVRPGHLLRTSSGKRPQAAISDTS